MNPIDLMAVGLLVLAVVLGMRSGALPQLGGLLGAAVGVFAALKLIPRVIPYLEDAEGLIRAGVVLAVLLGCIGVGEMLGARAGRTVSGRLGNGWLGRLDRLTGAIVGAGQAVLMIWLLGGILATGLVPSLRVDAQRSVAIRGIDVFLPAPEELIIGISTVLDQSGLPDVFLGLERLPADPVRCHLTRSSSASGSTRWLRSRGSRRRHAPTGPLEVVWSSGLSTS